MNKKNAALLSVASNSLLIIFKLIAGIMMNSISVISEAIHSGLDLVASLIAFFSIRKAVEPEDDEHPFGHGKYENVSGLVEAILIIFAAILIIYEAIRKIMHGSAAENLGIGMIVMLISSIINLFISGMLFKIAKKEDSIALEADAMHLLTDVFTSFGVFAGLVAIKFTGIQLLDPITAIIVATLIFKAAIDLTKKSMKDLVDSRLPAEEEEKIVNIIKSYPEITSYHRLRTRKSGNKREIDIHVRMNSEATLIEAHDLSHKISDDMKKEFPDCYILIHVEPQTIGKKS